jgi:hypothetical protein
VDLDARLVERWRPADEQPEVIRETLQWVAAGIPEPVSLQLPAIFAKMLGPL